MSETLTCLQHGDSCEGEVKECVAVWRDGTTRYRADGSFVVFPRCAKHHDEYWAAVEARERRDEEARRSNYCRHGNLIQDPHMCGECEDAG